MLFVPGDLVKSDITCINMFETLESKIPELYYEKSTPNEFCVVIAVMTPWIYIMTPANCFGWSLDVFFERVLI